MIVLGQHYSVLTVDKRADCPVFYILLITHVTQVHASVYSHDTQQPMSTSGAWNLIHQWYMHVTWIVVPLHGYWLYIP